MQSATLNFDDRKNLRSKVSLHTAPKIFTNQTLAKRNVLSNNVALAWHQLRISRLRVQKGWLHGCLPLHMFWKARPLPESGASQRPPREQRRFCQVARRLGTGALPQQNVIGNPLTNLELSKLGLGFSASCPWPRNEINCNLSRNELRYRHRFRKTSEQARLSSIPGTQSPAPRKLKEPFPEKWFLHDQRRKGKILHAA